MSKVFLDGGERGCCSPQTNEIEASLGGRRPDTGWQRVGDQLRSLRALR